MRVPTKAIKKATEAPVLRASNLVAETGANNTDDARAAEGVAVKVEGTDAAEIGFTR